jgi:phenylalanyl-tRNA synthetase alpha chain
MSQIDLQQIIRLATEAFSQSHDAAALANAKARFMGKESELTAAMKAMGKESPEVKAALGKQINVAKQAIEAALLARQHALDALALQNKLDAETIDVSLPGRGMGRGGLHPVSLTIERIETLFASIGFEIADGPEIEEDYFNFTALNTPENHPARSMHDTFYVEGDLLLRTHTSPMQIRYAIANQPPIKVIAPGKTYRVDSDATHSPMFHQFEGMWIDKNITFTDLKSVFTQFLRRFFEDDAIEVRFRASYFPFTEPSAEIDMQFSSGPLKGRWLEVAGSGQVHPTVIRNIGLDPEQYIGFAFGSGVERLAMLRYGVNDLRLFYENDLRFLKQFSFQA